MIFDSLGIGEVGVVLALAVVMIKPKELGKVMREFGKFKRKALEIQSQVRAQLETITIESEAIERQSKLKQDKASLRIWGKETIARIPAADRALAADALAARVAEWQTYKNAKAIACFVSTLDEIDTEPLLRRILSDGKALLLPFIQGEGAAAAMGFAPVRDLEGELAEGTHGIREPIAAIRSGEAPVPDLVLAPGLVFDLRGGRLGRGKGFYDRYLAGFRGFKAGLAYDVQFMGKNLPLDAHDQTMDAVVTDQRTQVFAAPRIEAA